MKKYFAKNFFRNLRMCELLANGIGNGVFVSCVCVAIFNKYGRTTEIVPSTMIVHQEEAMTQNNTTQLHYICI